MLESEVGSVYTLLSFHKLLPHSLVYGSTCLACAALDTKPFQLQYSINRKTEKVLGAHCAAYVN